MPNPCGRRAARLALSLACLPTGFVLAQASPDTAGQADSLLVAPGPQYDTGWLHRLFFGDHYRDLWSTPIEAPVLDLDGFAGGLKVTQRGGGEQTRSLRLAGPDGREYNFRSVNKWVSPDPRSDLDGTLAERLDTAFAKDCEPEALDWVIAYEHTYDGTPDVDALMEEI